MKYPRHGGLVIAWLRDLTPLKTFHLEDPVKTDVGVLVTTGNTNISIGVWHDITHKPPQISTKNFSSPIDPLAPSCLLPLYKTTPDPKHQLP